MLRKEVNLSMEGGVQFWKVNILILFKSLFCFFREDLGLSVPAGKLKKTEWRFSACCLSLQLWASLAGPGDRNSWILALALASLVPQFPSLYRGMGLPFLHPAPNLVEKVGPA